MDVRTMYGGGRLGRCKLADFDLGAVARGLFRLFEQPVGNGLLDVVLTAVGTDLSRNALEDDREAVAFQRGSGRSRPGLGLFAHDALHSTSEVFGSEAAVFGDSGQHPRADFLLVVESEQEVRPAGSAEHALRRSRLSFDDPPDAKQSGEDPIGLG